jgi:DNA polymerase III subunit epsilon
MGLFDGARLVAVDTETTGFDPALGHHVIEVACVPIDDGEIGTPWSRLVNPGIDIPAEAVAVHGITNQMVRGAPRAAEVAAELEARCAGRILVFHNAAFDLQFLNADFKLSVFDGLPALADLPLFGPRLIDTLGLARGFFGLGGNGLGVLAARLGEEAGTAHRAEGDALTTAGVLLKLGGLWEREKGVSSVVELAAASRDGMRLTHRGPRG